MQGFHLSDSGGGEGGRLGDGGGRWGGGILYKSAQLVQPIFYVYKFSWNFQFFKFLENNFVNGETYKTNVIAFSCSVMSGLPILNSLLKNTTKLTQGWSDLAIFEKGCTLLLIRYTVIN